MKLYDLLNNLSFIILVCHNFLVISRYKPGGGRLRSRAQRYRAEGCEKWYCNDRLWTGVEVVALSCFQYISALLLHTPFGKLAGTGANYFATLYFAPVFMLLGCLLLKLEPFSQIDLITPAFPLALVFVKISCFATGCCDGIYWAHGLPNAFTGVLEFPVQLLESGLALVIFIFLHRNRRRMKPGTVFPVYLTVYSATRFFSEFFRADPNVVGFLKTYHILCLIGIALGAAEYWLVNRIRDKRSAAI